MKRLFYIGWLCLTFAACSREELPDLSGSPASLTLSITTMQNDVKTRAVSPEQAERRIFNLYVFVFNEDGSIDHQQFYTFPSSDAGSKTLSIEGLMCGSGKSVAVVANVDKANSIVDIKATTLDAITSRTGLDSLIVGMQNEAIERGTSFLMSGIAESVTISADGATQVDVALRRVDAKIRFDITTGSGVTFTPSDWRVVSVPHKIGVMGVRPDLCSNATDCFNTEWAKFEEDGAKFAFYSMEHLPKVKTLIPTQGTDEERYALREKQEKIPTGSGNGVTNGDFMYAPATGTYVEMRGNVKYKGATDVEISADVVYTVHLGGVEGVDDYNTLRNTFYTYNVKIISVDKIEIEVASSDKEMEDEQRPGAVGDVTAAQTILNLDAHNEIFPLKFTRSDVDETLTWNVYTPFSEGSEADKPDDYKWIYFRINNKAATELRYNDNFRAYPGDQNIYNEEIDLDTYMADIAAGTDRLLDVKQLVSLLKESKRRNISSDNRNLFDTDYNIKFTAFVNEYYYETSPKDASATAEKGLWKVFTNRQQRVMNILSDLKYSPDHESSKSNAVLSIRQHAIQTMYNRSLTEDFTAWGIQMVQDETPVVFDKNGYSYVSTATDKSNGRKNTIELWKGKTRWADYITPTNWSMVSDYDAAKYKCLRMNRDNNGNGTIDGSEVQWYLAAINQLTDIWIGEWSYDPVARLYKKATWEKRYFVSSTVLSSYGVFLNKKDNPHILWSSEGSSIGDLKGAEGDNAGTVNTPVYYRCVRNLGMPRNADVDTKPSELAEYDPITHRISLKRLDAQSIRGYYQTTEELPVHHEREASNKPYWEFEVRQDVHGDNHYTWQSLFDFIQSGNRLCPDGYRVPNQRELALMLSQIGDDGHWALKNHFSRTRFKFATALPGQTRPGFSVSSNGGILFLIHGSDNAETGGVRCVKDYVQGKL